MRQEDIDVHIDGNVVTISAEAQQEQEKKTGGRVLRGERQHGDASRSFSLASAVDDGKADATHQNGGLELRLPKQATPTQKRVSVT